MMCGKGALVFSVSKHSEYQTVNGTNIEIQYSVHKSILFILGIQLLIHLLALNVCNFK